MLAHSDVTPWRSRLITMIGLMVISAVIISAAVIYYFSMFSEGAADVGSQIELAAITLLPYMISAVVAAITALGIITVLPSLRAVHPSQEIVNRLRELAVGDLSATVSVRGSTQLSEIAGALNGAVSSLNGQIAQLKVVNRQQWDVLCEIRTAAESNDCGGVLNAVAAMEKNWERLAALEAKLDT